MYEELFSIEDIIAITKKAGEKTLEFFQKDFDVQHKKDDSPVTEADLASNDILFQELSKYNIPILSEESEPPVDSEELMFIIDPLDGTSSFMKGTDDYSVMVGLAYGGRPVLGVVYQPSVNVLYYAEKGKGAFVVKEGVKKELHIHSEQIPPASARLVVSRRATTKESFISKIQEIGIESVTYLSSNGVKLGKIAEGEYDLFFNPSGKLGQWDYCAPHSIFEEAGGRLTYLNGDEVLYGRQWDESPHGVIATSMNLHSEILPLFRP